MGLVIVIALAFGGIIVLQAGPLFEKKMWRELAAFIFLMVVAMVYAYDWLLEWHLPTVKTLMEIVFIPVTVFIENLLTP